MPKLKANKGGLQHYDYPATSVGVPGTNDLTPDGFTPKSIITKRGRNKRNGFIMEEAVKEKLDSPSLQITRPRSFIPSTPMLPVNETETPTPIETPVFIKGPTTGIIETDFNPVRDPNIDDIKISAPSVTEQTATTVKDTSASTVGISQTSGGGSNTGIVPGGITSPNPNVNQYVEDVKKNQPAGTEGKAVNWILIVIAAIVAFFIFKKML